MTDLFKRFLEKIGVEHLSLYEGVDFKVLKNDTENKVIYVELAFDMIPSYTLVNDLLTHLEKSPFTVTLKCRYKVIDEHKVYDLLKEDLSHSLEMNNAMPTCYFNKGTISCIFYGNYHYEAFRPVLDMWEELLEEMSIPVEINADINYNNENLIKEREAAISEETKTMLENVYKRRLEASQSQAGALISGHYEKKKIEDINLPEELVEIDGEVFFSDERTTRKGKLIVTIYVFDHSSSMEVTIFENRRNFKKDNLEKYKEKGAHLTIRGRVVQSRTSKDLIIIASRIKVNEKPFNEIREDNEEEKRVELHSHTKMSTMDGLATVDDYFKQAAAWGHKAFAVTDHENCQAFPDVQVASKKYGVKAIYGVEMNMVEDHPTFVFNPSDRKLSNAEYVVFDFETTGLSSRYDRIIEFGAVKFKDGLIVDTMDIFVNPDMPLPKFIVSKTHITDSMVKGGLPIKKALEVIKDFIEDAILVAHNASFDVGFLNEALKNNNQEEITNPVIDTLALSMYMFPESKYHNLGALCRQYDINYDDNVAHRADYDSRVLNDAWLAMLSSLTKDNMELKHSDLALLKSDKMLRNARTSHVTVYAKNAAGLKDLFKLVSMSCTDYFADGTKIPRSVLQAYRENLILGSACMNGEVFQAALTRGEKALLEAMKFYDFIEVQPPANYVYLVNVGQVRSMDHIKNIINDIYNAASKLGKPVVATGDCHYLSKNEKIYRDVYITALSVGKGIHPLNREKSKYGNFDNPDQEFRTTTEMLDAFSFMGKDKAKEIVVTNTNKIASLFDDIYPIKDKLYPPFIENVEEKLVNLCYTNAKDLYGDPLPSIVKDRLEAELKGIIKHGYSVQYYIAHELVQQAYRDGFIVGSRGSVGSSFVAFASKVTEVNALQPHYRCPKCKYSHWDIDLNKYHSGYDLPDMDCPKCGTKMVKDGQNIPFATFLGFNAEKVPDIDLNFSGDYQAQAHNMTKVLLGETSVFRAGTIETVAEKTAFGYALGYYESLGIDTNTVSNAEKTRLAVNCQDVKKTTGQHPGGIIVIPRDMDVYDFTPVQYPADDVTSSWKTTHFDYNKIHENVLKLDLLGHVDPTALKMLEDLSGIKPQEVPFDDKKVISLFNSTAALNRKSNYLNEPTGALGLPEFGTNLTRQMLIATRPDTFADLLIISGLSHGKGVWQGNAEDLVNNGTCTLKEVIGCRDDIMNYLSSHGVDPSRSFAIMERVRKGKRLSEDDEKVMRENKIPEFYIASCNKINYLFPKAHAVAYVMMAVRIAWFKVYRPLDYYATFFSTRCDTFDINAMVKGEKAIIEKIERFKQIKEQGMKLSNKEQEIEKSLIIALELYERGFTIQNIDIYKSISRYWQVDEKNKSIIPPFEVLDGLGRSVAETIVEARKDREFLSIDDLRMRTKLSGQHIENLKKLGALKGLPESNQLSLFDFGD